MGKVHRLVPRGVSTDTVTVLEDLLLKARRGDIVGLAYIALRDLWTYEYDATGLAERHPTITCGALMVVAGEVAKQS